MLGKQTDLIEGNIFKALLVFAVPLLIGNLFQQLYNTADTDVIEEMPLMALSQKSL